MRRRFSELRPEMTPRGFISFCFDGRYKFSRYYAPDNFNTPTTFEELVGNNDLELFDLERDPDEMVNLAVDTERQPRAHPAPERAPQSADRPRGRRQQRQLPARGPAQALTVRARAVAVAIMRLQVREPRQRTGRPR